MKGILKAELELAKENGNERNRSGIYVMFSYFQLFVVLVVVGFTYEVAVLEDIYNFRKDTETHREDNRTLHLRIVALNLCTFRCKFFDMQSNRT